MAYKVIESFIMRQIVYAASWGDKTRQLHNKSQGYFRWWGEKETVEEEEGEMLKWCQRGQTDTDV